jgi:SAM-dependent methyltransferase
VLEKATAPLRSAWFDEARAVVQLPVLRDLTSAAPLTGECLNAGAGDGLFASFLGSFNGLSRIVHLDLARPEIAESAHDDRHTAVSGSLLHLPFPSLSFDCALCTEVIEHIHDDELALRELHRVLRPGAVLLVSVPSPPAPPDPSHVREGYALDELSDLLERVGFELKEHRQCFGAIMRATLRLWRWQFRVLGRGRRSRIPRFVVRSLGHLDRLIQIGAPWGLIVHARRR